jgi:Arc/MetJ family transcription regulator
MNCNQVVARAIRKFGLQAVRAAVEMAVELSTPVDGSTPKRKTKAAATTATSAAVPREP